MRRDSAPPDLARTREALHAVAEQVLAPARVRATGSEIALRGHARRLRHAPASPPAGVVRVQGAELVVEAADGGERRAPITTVRAAARLAGLDADELPDDALDVDPPWPRSSSAPSTPSPTPSSRACGADAEDPSPIHLWPEHFDLAFDAGDEAAGSARPTAPRRATRSTPSPTSTSRRGARPPRPRSGTPTGFTGAELAWADLVIDADPGAAALDFWRAARDALAS